MNCSSASVGARLRAVRAGRRISMRSPSPSMAWLGADAMHRSVLLIWLEPDNDTGTNLTTHEQWKAAMLKQGWE